MCQMCINRTFIVWACVMHILLQDKRMGSYEFFHFGEIRDDGREVSLSGFVGDF